MRRKREPSGPIGADTALEYEDEQFEHSSAAIGALGGVVLLLLLCIIHIEGFDRAHAAAALSALGLAALRRRLHQQPLAPGVARQRFARAWAFALALSTTPASGPRHLLATSLTLLMLVIVVVTPFMCGLSAPAKAASLLLPAAGIAVERCVLERASALGCRADLLLSLAALGVGGALGVALEQMLLLTHSRHAAVDTLRAAENQLLREEVEQLRTVRRGAPGGSSSSSPLARSAGAKERHAARAEREQRRRDEQQSALDQSLGRGHHLVHAMT